MADHSDGARDGSHAPGPPRFTTVGADVELAPRAPDPDGTYHWTLADAPPESSATVDDAPVVSLTPDVTGVYALELEAPDGTHRQRVRAFPDERRSVRVVAPVDDVVDELDVDSVPDPDDLFFHGQFNDHRYGRITPIREGDEFVREVRLPPGEHSIYVGRETDPTDQFELECDVAGPGRPRLRLDATVAGDEVVLTADAQAAPDGERPDDDVTVEFFADDRDDLTDGQLAVDGHEARVAVDDLPDLARVHAVPHGDRYGVADQVVLRTDADGVAVERPNDPPGWAESPTVYELFVRSFTGDTLDTTFPEIERRVDYLDSLGVDVLWLTPVLASPTTHGYHVTDFFDTAADLGTRAEFESLVERCHESDIRVVFDLVINHTSRDHAAFQLHVAGVEAYRDHYRLADAEFDVTDVDWAQLEAGRVPEYYFNWQRIPNLNYGSPTVRDWLLDVVDEWAGVVDGFRCDVAWGVPHGFWKEVADRTPDDFLLLDETIPRDPFYHEGEFHMHYDTTLFETLRDVGTGATDADAVLDAVADARAQGFPEAAVHLRYVENHDEDRYLADCEEPALRAAAAATFTLPGAPMIYYGQERRMTDCRGPMRWHDGDAALTEFHRRLSRLRDEHPVLRDGDVERIAHDVVTGDPESVTAYARDDGDDRLLVALNFGGDPATVAFEEPTAGDADLLTGEPAGTEGGVRVDSVVVLAAD